MTPREIDNMRKAGKIVASVLQTMAKLAQPGVTPKSLAEIAETKTLRAGAVPTCKGYHGFPAAICISVNDAVVHGVPSDQPLKVGDLVKFDFACSVDGIHADSAITVGIGKMDEEDVKLMRATRTALYRGIETCAPGQLVCMVSLAVEAVAREHAYQPALHYTGHGIGKKLHQTPDVPNTFLGAPHTALKSGTAVAIEPMFCMGTGDTKVLEDRWTAVTRDGLPAAHFEHTVLILDNGVEVVTEWDEESRKMLVPLL